MSVQRIVNGWDYNEIAEHVIDFLEWFADRMEDIEPSAKNSIAIIRECSTTIPYEASDLDDGYFK